MSPLDHKLLPVFLEEAMENLIAIEGALATPTDKEAMEKGYRAAHTIKGTAALVKLSAPSTVARRLEDAFEALQQSAAQPSPDEQDALRHAAAVLRSMIEGASAGIEPQESATEDVDRRLQSAAAATPSPSFDIVPALNAHPPETPETPETPEPPQLPAAGFACCRFRVAGRPFFLAMTDMVEIAECPPLTPLPLAPPYLPGLANLRGSVLPIIDFAPLRGAPPTEASGGYLVVAASGGERIAFLSEEMPALALAGEGERVDVADFIARHRVGGL